MSSQRDVLQDTFEKVKSPHQKLIAFAALHELCDVRKRFGAQTWVEYDFKSYLAFTFTCLILLRDSYSHKRASTPRGNVPLKLYREGKAKESNTGRESNT